MWTAGIRVFGRCAIYPVCEIIQPCTTQCIARTIRKAKISYKTSMFKPSAQDFLTPFGTFQRYTTLFDSFTDFSFHFYAILNFFSIMVRLTDVQRGRAVALLMQGQRQQQVANDFGVNVSTIERLVRPLRETGHLADWLRSGRPRVTSRRQDRTIRLAHLRNRHLTATETALNTVGTHNRQISPKTVGSRLREIGLRARRPYVGLPLTQARRMRRMAISDEAVETSSFYGRVWVHSLSPKWSTSCVPTSRRMLCWRLCCRTGSVWGWLRYGLGRHCSRDKITVDYCCGQYDRSKV